MKIKNTTLEKSRKHHTIVLAVLAVMLLAAIPAAAAGGSDGFVHGPTIDVDGEAYYIWRPAPTTASTALPTFPATTGNKPAPTQWHDAIRPQLDRQNRLVASLKPTLR